MLTCRINGIKVNVFSTEEIVLREWSKNGEMCCVGCGERVIYNHGEIKDVVYLRHYRSESCLSEKETEEHDRGKLLMYEHLLLNKNFTNVNVEHYIPETKQIADIYLEYKGKKIVIEYQCTPISTPLLQRSRKYEDNGYHVIWIFGINNYNISNFIFSSRKSKDITDYKMIASEMNIMFESSHQLVYFNPEDSNFYNLKENSIKNMTPRPRKTKYNFQLEKTLIDDYDFEYLFSEERNKGMLDRVKHWVASLPEVNKNSFKTDSNSMAFHVDDATYRVIYIKKFVDSKDLEKIKENSSKIGEIPLIILDAGLYNIKIDKEFVAYGLVGDIFYDSVSNKFITLNKIRTEKWSSYYGGQYDMDYYRPEIKDISEYWIMGENIVDDYLSLVELRRTYTIFNEKEKEYLGDILSEHYKIYRECVERNKKELNKAKKLERKNEIQVKIGDILNTEIIIHDGFYKIPDEIRFKFLKEVEYSDFSKDEFILNNFSNMVRSLKNRNPSGYVIFMLPKCKINGRPYSIDRYDRDKIQSGLESYGFTKIKITGGNFTIDQ